MFADKTAIAHNTANTNWIPTSTMRLDSIPRTFPRTKWEQTPGTSRRNEVVARGLASDFRNIHR
jgi:hypothetical protein